MAVGGVRPQEGQDAGILQVRQTLTRTTRDTHLGPPKSPKSRRTVPLLPEAVEALKSHRARQNARHLAAGEHWQDSDLIIDGGDGGPVNPSTFSTAWRTWCKREGFEAVGGFHQLRRGCSSLLRAAGVDPLVISEVMGHTDTRFTERVYTDVFSEAKRAAMDKLGPLVAPGV